MFPAASDAVQVTGVVPIVNVEPKAGSQVGPLVTPTLSVAASPEDPVEGTNHGNTIPDSLDVEFV